MGTSNAACHENNRTPISKKRSRNEAIGDQVIGGIRKPIEVSSDEDALAAPKKKTKKSKPDPNEEKRFKRWREKAPVQWQQRYERATSQAMYVLDRKREVVDGVPQETVEMAGSTGKVYNVIIAQIPSCTCPDAGNGHICKHIIYVLHLVLKAPADLKYQAAFLKSELQHIFDASPLLQPVSGQGDSGDSNRKAIEGDCPICFMEFEPEMEDIAWCRSSCGNNIHKECLEKWIKSQAGKEIRCVYCRAPWQQEELSLDAIRAAKAKKTPNAQGYINLAAELGIPSSRDTSTYHQFWVNRQRRDGHTF